MKKSILFISYSLFVLALLLPQPSYAWKCAWLEGTCTPPEGRSYQTEGVGCTKYADGSSRLYCPYFQCDANGDVILSNNILGIGVGPKKKGNGGMKNCGGHIYAAHQCHSNCCYEGKLRGGEIKRFSHEINIASARNVCCKTLQAYMKGDCSYDNEFLPEEEEEVIEEPESPGLIGDPGGDGNV